SWGMPWAAPTGTTPSTRGAGSRWSPTTWRGSGPAGWASRSAPRWPMSPDARRPSGATGGGSARERATGGHVLRFADGETVADLATYAARALTLDADGA